MINGDKVKENGRRNAGLDVVGWKWLLNKLTKQWGTRPESSDWLLINIMGSITILEDYDG